MKYLFSILILLFSQLAVANCDEDMIRKISRGGEIITTLSGKVFEVMAGDIIDSMLWLPTSDLIVCGPKFINYKGKQYPYYTLINTDENEKVDAFRLK